MNYVLHFCKNKKCNNAWIDEDLTNAQSRPPSWKYCQECCKKYGYVNPAKPPKRNKTDKQLENLKKGRDKLAKKRADKSD